MTATLDEVYDRLLQAFGPQQWWPAETPFEVMVGAVLVQNTAWKNVERAIANLREAALLDPHALWRLSPSELEDLIRPAGSYRIKARRLRHLLEYLITRFDGSLDAMADVSTDTLREELLALYGIGPETADSILLYALGRAVFVVDTYTARVLKRHAWIEPEADYHAIQEHFEANLDRDAAKFNEYHALLVHVGHHFCRSKPKCEECPLRDLLPAGGIAEPM
ncbi:MAG: endonuclease III domain-containing protein [Planctomycetia bacterium]|nr:endonuclease III domain-containing protein [Planctomycetia bacterium]